MHRILTPLTSAVTYSRWLHMFIPAAAASVWFFISDAFWAPLLFAVPIGLIPAMRLEEGIQAQLLLTPSERGRPDASIAAASSSSWAERWRTVLWLEVRLLISAGAILALWLPVASIELVLSAAGRPPGGLAEGLDPHWWNVLLAPLPIIPLLVLVVLGGRLSTAAARWLLGPSPTDRLTVLEGLTEELLERNRMARELHDSIGHALTVAVVQAGAARTANDPAFTERALAAIEETGRDALEDLERVLRVLRESGTPVSRRPTLAEAERLLDSARSSGAKVDARVSGDLGLVPGPGAGVAGGVPDSSGEPHQRAPSCRPGLRPGDHHGGRRAAGAGGGQPAFGGGRSARERQWPAGHSGAGRAAGREGAHGVAGGRVEGEREPPAGRHTLVGCRSPFF